MNVWRRTRQASTALAVCALTVIGVAGCGSSDDESAAGTESVVIVYSTMKPEVQGQLAAEFESNTGIKVTWTRELTSVLTRRFDEETNAGKHNVDVLTMGEEIYAIDKASEFVDLTGLNGMEAVGKEWRLTDQTFVPMFAPEKIAYNKSKFKGSEDELPTSWKDLLDPRFKGGKILFTDPRSNPVLTSKSLYNIVQSEGEQFLSDLAAQKIVTVAGASAGMEELAAGTGELLVSSYDMNLLAYAKKGAPIGLIEPFGPVSGLTFYTQIPKNAPHMDNAKKFVEYLFSIDGQTIVNRDIGVSPLGETVPGSLIMPDSVANPAGSMTLEQLPHYLDLLDIK